MKNKIPKEMIELFFVKNTKDEITAKMLLEFYLHHGTVKNANKFTISISDEELKAFEKKLKTHEKKIKAYLNHTLEQHRIYMMDRAGSTGIDKEILKQSDLTKNYNLF